MQKAGLTFASLLACSLAHAQWDLQDSHSTADLRGIDNVGNGVAWASGTNGTVLRTEDGGYLWQSCSIPPGAEHLDFRGIQAFDANTAIVMSSGKGDLSRLYKTTDGCDTWKLVFTNPDKDGFWDALRFADRQRGYLFGDPVAVNGSPELRFELEETYDGGNHWTIWQRKIKELMANGNDCGFAASNSSLLVIDRYQSAFGTGCAGGALFYGAVNTPPGFCDCHPMPPEQEWWSILSVSSGAPGPFPKTDSGGIFSIASGTYNAIVAVGGDYKKPDNASNTSATTHDWGRSWQAAETPPHGYRSAVAYDAASKTWITVGPNGTDVSTDDGKNWRALHPDPALHEPLDADRDWNALSLPFVVGPHGRIGKLNPHALPPHPSP
jgi:photosystem II stability/assembly factor-like uncharacterized protein